MNRKKECVRVFAGAAAFAYALYALTLPEGLPWGVSTTLPGTWMGVALAVGFFGSLVTRYLGWRCGAAAALIFTCVPEVWNRTILGDRGMAFVAFAVSGLWLLNAILLWGISKAREAQKTAPAVTAGATAAQKRSKVNGIAAWIFLGLAALYAIVSITLHDYKLGESASVFAKGVVEEAEERVVVLNGVLDEQVVRESKLRVEVEERTLSSGAAEPLTGGQGLTALPAGQPNKKRDLHSSTSISDFDFHTISLRNDEVYRTNLVAWVRSAFPGETNLYLAAQVSVAAFLDVAVKAHPDRFYLMNGQSSTLAGWEKRWEAMKPYLKSRDPFVPMARRMFGYEGNAVGNAMLDEGEKKVEGEGRGRQRNLTTGAAEPLTGGQGLTALPAGQHNEKGDLHCQPQPSNSTSSTVWRLYKRIYEEIDPGNASALFNLNEMIRRGYKVSGDEKRWVTDKVAAFFKDEANRRYVREFVKISGPVRADPAVVEQLKEEAERRTQERIASGEKIELPSEVKDVFEQNDKMVAAMEKDDRETAAKLAREILSKPGWRTWGPANAVMGEILSDAGDYAAAEVFFGIAIANEKETPDVVVNNYADVLMQLGKTDEAERILRELIAKRGETAWGPCFTLAEVLTKKVEKVGGGGQRSFEPVRQEVRELVAAVMKHAPGEMKQLMREKQRKGEILK